MVISYLGAVYGPLSAIAHTTGQLQGAMAGAKRVRAMFAMTPETDDEPDAIDAVDIEGDIKFEGVGFTYPTGRRFCTTSTSRPSRGRWSRWSA